MAITFHILSASGILAGPLRDRLQKALDVSAARSSALLDLSDIDVVVMNTPFNVIPRIGVNGFSYDAHQIMLSLDHQHPHLTAHFES